MGEVRKIKPGDITQVVSIHLNAFKGFFLTDLGPDFLRLYYNSVLNHKLGCMQGYFDDGVLIGFSASTLKSRGFNKSLVNKNLFRFSIFGLKFLLFKSSVLVRLVRNLSKSANGLVKDDGNYAELLSIGIDSDQQGKGIGKQLLIQLEKDARSANVVAISLTTDFFDNEKAVNFYKSMGYVIFYEFITYPNRKMYRMIKELK